MIVYLVLTCWIIEKRTFSRNYIFVWYLQKSVPLSPGSQKRQINHSQIGNDKGYLWKMSCLRPAPPTRSYLSQPGDTTGGAKRSSGSTKKGTIYHLIACISRFIQIKHNTSKYLHFYSAIMFQIQIQHMKRICRF